MSTQVSDEILEQTPARVSKFLYGLGAAPAARTQMEEAGLTDAALEEGRTLLLDCLAAPAKQPAATDTPEARASRAAAAELDGWDESNFAVADAALTRFFPDVQRYVFNGLAPARGTDAIRGVATFLARITALADGTDPERAATRDTDRKAVALLDARGINAAERERVAALVQTALRPTPALPARSETNAAERMEKLRQLRAWFEDWSAVARARVKNRAHLIRLGLAQRRAATAATDEPA